MKYKCPICGCEEFYLISAVTEPGKGGLFEYEIELWGDAYLRKNTLSGSFETRVCKSCGHVDLYKNPRDIQRRINEHEQKISNANQQVKAVEDRIEELKKQNKADEERLVYLEKQLKSDEITVRQQREFQDEFREVRERIASFPTKLSRLQNELSEVSKQRSLISKNF